MIVFVCVDERGGMTFNGRRLSRDKTITDKIAFSASVCKKTLRMNPYSAPLFKGNKVYASEDYLDRATWGEYCFVEKESLAPYIDKIEAIVVFKWNRSYPYDSVLDIDTSKATLLSTHNFEGSSHEKITEEFYVL